MSIPPLSRRGFLTIAVPAAALSRPGVAADRGWPDDDMALPSTPAQGTNGIPPSFPAQDPATVKEMVTVSHFNLARVKELVGRQPALARAAWDWGFGDWESALGAASHMGNRDIAEFLLANGARPTIFSAAMLGQLDVVRAFVTAIPGIQATKGPHSITLLAHAKAGGERARPVLDYLMSVGGADPAMVPAPLTEDDTAKIVGTYVFGRGPDDTVEIARNDRDPRYLTFTRKGGIARGLTHHGGLAFSPAGADAVRVRFALEPGPTTLTVHDPDVRVTAVKDGGR